MLLKTLLFSFIKQNCIVNLNDRIIKMTKNMKLNIKSRSLFYTFRTKFRRLSDVNIAFFFPEFLFDKKRGKKAATKITLV